MTVFANNIRELYMELVKIDQKNDEYDIGLTLALKECFVILPQVFKELVDTNLDVKEFKKKRYSIRLMKQFMEKLVMSMTKNLPNDIITKYNAEQVAKIVEMRNTYLWQLRDAFNAGFCERDRGHIKGFLDTIFYRDYLRP